MKREIYCMMAALLLTLAGTAEGAAKSGPLPPPPPGRMGMPPGPPGLPPPLPRTPLPKPMRQIQVARPALLPGAPAPPPPVRMNPPSPYQMVPPPPQRLPGEREPLCLLPYSQYQMMPEPLVPISQPQRTSPLGPYRLGTAVSFTSLFYLPPPALSRGAAPASPPASFPTAAEQAAMRVYWSKVQAGTASAEERTALEALVRKYPHFDFAQEDN